MRAKRPRCYLLHAVAPPGTLMRTANDAINAMTADRILPLAIFHDHFLDAPGGMIIFHVDEALRLDALEGACSVHLPGWNVELRPLIFSYSPAAFDEQIAYTLGSYQGENWERLRREKRPAYGNPAHETVSGVEE
jgi:hypothetical protein